ncbi:hypothetical protein DKX38_026421 [Salix brachista]|uniref:Uncharacterized protein n=1 Tax=Salix brachista TaxID=2182728 RepID=A0A5N5JES1_9ROSI|nr:hypothetical protein DKX38_026421 [Salix brachista]
MIEAELNKVKDTLIMEKKASIQSNEESLKITEDLRTLTDWLQEEKSATGKELEALKAELSITKQQLESVEKQVADGVHNMKVIKEENESLTLKLSEISNDLEQAQNTFDGLISESGKLKEKLRNREREYSTLEEMHEIHGNESSARVKELEVQVKGLELELKSSQARNRDLEVHIEEHVKEVQIETEEHPFATKTTENTCSQKEETKEQEECGSGVECNIDMQKNGREEKMEACLKFPGQ